MGQPVKDRRREPRYVGSPDDITRATLRPGRIVQVVDLSASGALVQADRPLRPGAHVHFHFVIGRREFRLTARVLRCAVWMLDSLEGITYRGALQFDERCEWWGAGTQDGSDRPTAPEPNCDMQETDDPESDAALLQAGAGLPVLQHNGAARTLVPATGRQSERSGVTPSRSSSSSSGSGSSSGANPSG